MKPLHPQLCQSIFVAGTDTGVGKTHVCVQLLQRHAAEGRRVGALKPVAAGAVATPEGLRNDDALLLQAAANLALPYKWVNPYCLPRATSPHLAAQDAGIEIDSAVIVQAYASIKQKCDLVVVEGAGGWLAPIADPRTAGSLGATMQDVAVALGLPVVLVVGIRLGSLNHALLTAEAIRRSGLTLAGWVANRLDANFADCAHYESALTLRLPEPQLLAIDWQF